jgi:hypothetical protein
MSDHQTTLEAAMAASAPKIMYGGAGAAGASFWLSNEVLGLIGVLIALAGFFINWHYKRKEDRRQQAEHEARMAEMGAYE